MSEPPQPRIFTIGHSNHAIEDFVALLKRFEIQVVVDVRSEPYSKYSPQFNARTLEGLLEREEIRYLFLGRELGGRPREAEYYDREERVDYGRLAASPRFRDGRDTPGTIQRPSRARPAGIRKYGTALATLRGIRSR